MEAEKGMDPQELLSWGEGLLCGACRYPVSEAAKATFRAYYTAAALKLASEPKYFAKIKGQLAFWIERQASVAACLVDCSRGVEVLPEHLVGFPESDGVPAKLGAFAIVKSWKIDGATSLCNGV
jgi:hypothetical protein